MQKKQYLRHQKNKNYYERIYTIIMQEPTIEQATLEKIVKYYHQQMIY